MDYAEYWLKKAIIQLKRQKVALEIGDVLSKKDYAMYKKGGNPVIL